jgi:hypothetical protein
VEMRSMATTQVTCTTITIDPASSCRIRSSS